MLQISSAIKKHGKTLALAAAAWVCVQSAAMALDMRCLFGGPKCRYQGNPCCDLGPCWGFNSTCWRRWPDCCPNCPPPVGVPSIHDAIIEVEDMHHGAAESVMTPQGKNSKSQAEDATTSPGDDLPESEKDLQEPGTLQEEDTQPMPKPKSNGMGSRTRKSPNSRMARRSTSRSTNLRPAISSKSKKPAAKIVREISAEDAGPSRKQESSDWRMKSGASGRAAVGTPHLAPPEESAKVRDKSSAVNRLAKWFRASGKKDKNVNSSDAVSSDAVSSNASAADAVSSDTVSSDEVSKETRNWQSASKSRSKSRRTSLADVMNGLFTNDSSNTTLTSATDDPNATANSEVRPRHASKPRSENASATASDHARATEDRTAGRHAKRSGSSLLRLNSSRSASTPEANRATQIESTLPATASSSDDASASDESSIETISASDELTQDNVSASDESSVEPVSASDEVSHTSAFSFKSAKTSSHGKGSDKSAAKPKTNRMKPTKWKMI